MLYRILMKNNSPVDLDSSAPPLVTLSVVASWCGAGDCPTVYRTDRGTLVVQGYTFNPETAGVAVPDGERMVEIPAELLAQLTGAAPEMIAGDAG
jgi:hypothetical protein